MHLYKPTGLHAKFLTYAGLVRQMEELMEVDACHGHSPLPTSSLEADDAQLVQLLRRVDHRRSYQQVLQQQELLVTTSVCVEQQRPGRWPLLPVRWFRVGSANETTNNFCQESPRPLLRTAGMGGVWLPQLSAVAQCQSQQVSTYRRHDYCFAPSSVSSPPANETAWLPGLTLFATERHSVNFNHFNRDVMFWNRMHQRWPHLTARLVGRDADDLSEWSQQHLRATLPANWLNRIIWTGDHRHAGVGALPRKHNVSGALAPPAKYVCLEAVAEKLAIYSGDGRDLALLRHSAYQYCGVRVAQHAVGIPTSRPSDLLLEVRGSANTTTRRVANDAELRQSLSTSASLLYILTPLPSPSVYPWLPLIIPSLKRELSHRPTCAPP